MPRIELQLPVNPWRTRAPCGPPSMLSGSAPEMIGAVTLASLVGVVPDGLVPPVVGSRLPVRVGDDAVHRAHRRQALLAARAQLRDDDHVDAVVEDRAELRRAVADARVAIDADRHVDQERRGLAPWGVLLAGERVPPLPPPRGRPRVRGA